MLFGESSPYLIILFGMEEYFIFGVNKGKSMVGFIGFGIFIRGLLIRKEYC